MPTGHLHLDGFESLPAAKEKSDRMVVTGSAGTMEFSVHGKMDVAIRAGQGNLLEAFEIRDPVTVEQPMVESVVEDLLGLSRCEIHARDVVSTYAVIDKVLDGFYGGRQDDFWNHPERFGK